MSCCLRCKRPLQNPQSVEQGMGPVCRRRHRLQAEGDETQGQFIDLAWDPATMDVVCRREPDHPTRRHFNIPQVLVVHSPTGMEWGFVGSGPRDFALNILRLFTDCDQDALDVLAADFARDVVAALPEPGGTIRGETVRDWLFHYQDAILRGQTLLPIFA